MRLTCPSCAAAYEVEAGLIAPGGQHVQCSACHARWFTRAPARPEPAEQVSEDDIIARLEARPGSIGPSQGSRRSAQPILRAVGPDAPESRRGEEALAGSDFVWKEPPADPASGTERPHLRVVQTPPAGAEPAGPAAPETDARRTRAEPATVVRPRLDLDPAPEPAPASVPTAKPNRRFWPGFATGLAISALPVALYSAADAIAEAVPAVEPFLASYADTVDGARIWLEARLGTQVETLRRAAGLAG